MTKSTLDSQNIWTERALQSCTEDTRLGPNVRLIWWRNPTNYQSLRLTSVGYNFFVKQAEFNFYKIELDPGITSRQLIQLERLFTEPYFIKSHNLIFVMSEQDAIMLQLHAGNLGRYLDSIQNG